MPDMLLNLPQQYRGDPTVQALAAAMQGVLAAQEDEAGGVPSQMSLDKVTWGLETEERLLGITPADGATLEERRTLVKARWRSGGKLTIEQVQAVCDAWRDGEVIVTFPGSKLRLQFVGAVGVPTDLDALVAAVQLVIPAHLALEYIFEYLLIRDIHEVMTVDQLETQAISKFAFRGGQT